MHTYRKKKKKKMKEKETAAVPAPKRADVRVCRSVYLSLKQSPLNFDFFNVSCLIMFTLWRTKVR